MSEAEPSKPVRCERLAMRIEAAGAGYDHALRPEVSGARWSMIGHLRASAGAPAATKDEDAASHAEELSRRLGITTEEGTKIYAGWHPLDWYRPCEIRHGVVHGNARIAEGVRGELAMVTPDGTMVAALLRRIGICAVPGEWAERTLRSLWEQIENETEGGLPGWIEQVRTARDRVRLV